MLVPRSKDTKNEDRKRSQLLSCREIQICQYPVPALTLASLMKPFPAPYPYTPKPFQAPPPYHHPRPSKYPPQKTHLIKPSLSPTIPQSVSPVKKSPDLLIFLLYIYIDYFSIYIVQERLPRTSVSMGENCAGGGKGVEGGKMGGRWRD